VGSKVNPPLEWSDAQLTAADIGIWAGVVAHFGEVTQTHGMGIYHHSMDSDARDYELMRQLEMRIGLDYTFKARAHSCMANGFEMSVVDLRDGGTSRFPVLR
jgi:hypothetical protein